MSFLHAEKTGQREYYLASAVYAYAFLFPGRTDASLNPFDPDLRTACDLYNHSLTAGFASDDGIEVEVHAGDFRLPFGTLAVTFDETQLQWGDRRLTHFIPTAELEVSGLRNRYRQTGIGASLANGMVDQFEIYVATVIWDATPRSILVDEAETTPLVGMGLLRGYDLSIRVVNGGMVMIVAVA